MKQVVAIRHVAFEDLGILEPLLLAEGFRVRYVDAGAEDIGALKALDPQLVVVLGGPIGAYDEKDYPFIEDELLLLERRLVADRPTLGICLGAQLMARSLGARVYAGAVKEIGWSGLQLTEDGWEGPLRHLAPLETQVLHWHGDTFDPPEGAVRLASSDQYENQAFSWGNNGLALQFHPEVTAGGLEKWFIGHTTEISLTGLSVRGLREETARQAPKLEVQGRRCFAEWLQRLEF